LYRAGVTGIEIEDARDFQEFLETRGQYWDYVDDALIQAKSGGTRVKIYVSDDGAGSAVLEAAREAVASLRQSDTDGRFGSLDVTLGKVYEEDWANGWKKYFKPIPVGERILIKPQWEAVDPGGRIVFEINPGMAFGTGTHETTRLCICALERYVTPGCKVLDLGCGSGILSVIARLLGAGSAAAADLDPNCERAALENAQRNGVADNYAVYCGNITEDEALKRKLGTGYDIVAANIVADVLIPLASEVKRYLKDGGVLICSGIIDFRKDDVAAALERNGLKIIDTASEGEWFALTARAG
jgi:ribosomal protein L11 methyltransferase